MFMFQLKVRIWLWGGVVVQTIFLIQAFHLSSILFSTWSVLSTCQGHHRTVDAECFVDGDFWADLSACHHSNLQCLLPLLLCRWGNVVPMYIFSNLFGQIHGMRDHCYLGWYFCFSGCWCRGNWPICPHFK